MFATFDVKNPPKRKIPKCRISRQHHYVMVWPTDFKFGTKNCKGLPYTPFFDSFLEDCVNRMYKYAPEMFEYGESEVMTACLN